MSRQISESPAYLTRQMLRTSRYANLFPHVREFSIQHTWWAERHRYLEDTNDGATLRDLRTDPEEPCATHPPALTHDRTD